MAWTFVTLRMPLWSWLYVLVLAMFAFGKNLQAVKMRMSAIRLFVNEDGEVQSKTMSDRLGSAAQASHAVIELTEKVNDFCGKLERLKYMFSLQDELVSAVGIAIMLVLATQIMAAGVILNWLAQLGFWRYILWMAGNFALLPPHAQVALAEYAAKVNDWRRARAHFSKLVLEHLRNFFVRVPDGFESSHLHLCRRYVFAKPLPVQEETRTSEAEASLASNNFDEAT